MKAEPIANQSGPTEPILPAPVWAILALSLALNFWGIWFGLPDSWHADELVSRSGAMARERTLNPHSFLYGSLHYYFILAVSLPAYAISNLFSSDYMTHKTMVYLVARGLTALMGAGCVFLTYLLGRLLFNTVSGIIAALCLTLSLGFINIAHFATVDVPMLFWMMLSFLMAGSVLRVGGRRCYVAAGVFAGFAAATKYVGGVALLTLIVAYLLQPERRDHLGMLWGVLAAAVAFVVANPPLLLASCEFFEGFLIDNAFNTSFGEDLDGIALVRPLVQLYHVLGAALSILAGAALIYGIWLLVRREHWRSVALIGSMFVPFLLVISNVNYAFLRHVLPLAPPLLLLVGKMMSDLMAARHRVAFSAGLVVGMVTIVYSGLCALSGELQFTFDGRNLATAWVVEHAAPGSKIEVTPYGPRLPDDRFVVEKRPFLRNLTADITNLRDASLYRTLRPIYLYYKSAAESIGLCEPRARHYLGWYEVAESQAAADLANFDPSIDGLEARAPDLLIISSFYYERFLNDPTGPDGHFFKQLFEERGSYRPIAEFHYELLPWLDPTLEFINPTVRIFQKEPLEP